MHILKIHKNSPREIIKLVETSHYIYAGVEIRTLDTSFILNKNLHKNVAYVLIYPISIFLYLVIIYFSIE
jgi:hypothetical protein